jgi:hypothetical protein
MRFAKTKIEKQINLATPNEQPAERVPVDRVKIDDELIALDVVMRREKRFVFEIMRDNGNCLIASSDERKSAKRAARAGNRFGSKQRGPRLNKNWINKP